MAAPTNTYVNYATGTGHGNDYKGATFTNGAYTSATKTLVKASAFAANLAGHWLYLESNDGGSIVAGFYKIATWTDANTVVLATDAGAGVDDDAAKCVQHDGTTSLPWRSIQGALDLITRDATNGDQINVKAGTAVVNQAALALTTYGTPAEGAPLIIRGYTTAANDRGMGEIDCNGLVMWAVTTHVCLGLIDLEIHNGGNNNLITNSGIGSFMYHCEVHKGASSPSAKGLINSFTRVVGCYVHDAGTSGYGISATETAYGNFVEDCPNGINVAGVSQVVFNNIVVDSTVIGIRVAADNGVVIGNSIYSSTANTGKGISVEAGHTHAVILNNIVQGYSGVAGVGLSAAADVAVMGYNAFYNNTANESLGDVMFNLENDAEIVGATSPFTNAAGGDFSLNTAVAGAIDGAFPGAWYGPASTTDHADIGAVQNPAGAGTSVRHPRGLWIMR